MGEKVGDAPKGTYGQAHKRDRRETQLDALALACALKHMVARYVMNERRVPKRWRYMVGKPAIDYAARIRDCVSAANDIRMDGGPPPEDLKRREALQREALSCCNILQLQMMDIEEECEGATAESMGEITRALLELTRKIPRWIQSDARRAGGAGGQSPR